MWVQLFLLRRDDPARFHELPIIIRGEFDVGVEEFEPAGGYGGAPGALDGSIEW